MPDSVRERPASPEAARVGVLAPGHRIGRYEVLRHLGDGHDSEGYAARLVGNTTASRPSLVQRLRPERADFPDEVERFISRARVAVTLHHPNLVEAHELCMVGREYFVALELVHGADLRQLWAALAYRGQAVPLGQALAIAAAACAGLHALHEKVGADGEPLGLIHGELGPEHVVVGWDGAVKVHPLDVVSVGVPQPLVAYSSPEQLRGEAGERRADVHALGAILFELTTGRRLDRGDEDQLRATILDGKHPRPRELDASYPALLEAIVMRALATEPAARFESAREMQQAIESFGRHAHLDLSASAVGRLMRRSFPRQVEGWRAAQAQRKTLAEHLRATTPPRPQVDPDVDLVPPHRPPLPAIPTPPAVTAAVVAPREPVAARAASPAPTASVPPVPMPVAVDELPHHGPPWRGWLKQAALAAVVCVGGAALAAGTWSLTHRAPRTDEVPHLAKSHLPSARVLPPPRPVAPPPAPPPLPPPPATGEGIVEVTTQPPGASLWIDGHRQLLTSPARLQHVTPGAHVLTARLEGYHEEKVPFAVGPSGALPLSVRLFARKTPSVPGEPGSRPATSATPGSAPPAPQAAAAEGVGELLIESTPACAISVDGTPHGQTPMRATLPAGRHAVVLANPELEIWRSVDVYVTAGAETHKRIDLSRR